MVLAAMLRDVTWGWCWAGDGLLGSDQTLGRDGCIPRAPAQESRLASSTSRCCLHLVPAGLAAGTGGRAAFPVLSHPAPARLPEPGTVTPQAGLSAGGTRHGGIPATLPCRRSRRSRSARAPQVANRVLRPSRDLLESGFCHPRKRVIGGCGAC